MLNAMDYEILRLIPTFCLVLPSLRSTGGFKSCDTLLKRIENDDSTLETVVFLPMKSFGSDEVVRLAHAIGP